MDQHDERKSVIPDFPTKTEDTVPMSIKIETTTDIPDGNPSAGASNLRSSLGISYTPYTPNSMFTRFAMTCDKFGIKDDVAAAMATAIMKDFGVKARGGRPAIVTKSKVHQWKLKCRQAVISKRFDASTLLAFSFHIKKTDSITHLAVVKEPNSQLLGYIKLANEDAENKVNKINGFLTQKKFLLDSLIGICCDGEPTNTDASNGILRRFEIQLKRPLHWFVCLLHLNDLSFWHLFDYLKTSTRKRPGQLSKQIETCENIAPVTNFVPIPLENVADLSVDESSTDSNYLLKIAKAVSSGEVSKDLAEVKPGPIAHPRMITTVSRLLRLYVTTDEPSNTLKTLVQYIMKVFVPMYFNVKCYNSVVYGSVLLYKFICWTQYLDLNLKQIVHNVITQNAYYAHPENILLTMLFDDRKETRDLAIQKILYYRKYVEEPLELRAYKIPSINFNCTDYTDMIDLNDSSNLFEPPFTVNIPYEHLEQYLEKPEPPLVNPMIPLHILETERHVEFLACGSKKVLDDNGQLESCEKLPKLE